VSTRPVEYPPRVLSTTDSQSRRIRHALKAVVFVFCGLPAVLFVWDAFAHRSSVNPYNAIIRDTGFWSLRFLCVTIAITPARWLTHWHTLIRFRRMMGLFAFFYGVLHLAAYFVFDHIAAVSVADRVSPLSAVQRATWSASVEIVERPFFAIGVVALALLVPLAATSTARMIRTLGGRRWQALHRLVYPAAIASVVHTYWPLTPRAPRYAVILGVVLLLRLGRAVARRPAASVLPRPLDPTRG
jgi:sulfoxide reductase heme-binding subunit YedZ